MLKFLKALFGGENSEPTPSPSSQKTQEYPFKPPSKTQLEECERLGLEVKTGMSSRNVWQMVNEAKKDPRIKVLDDAYLAKQWAIQEAEDREEYGDVVVDNYKRMEALCRAGVHHIVVFKKGKQAYADILEFERASIEDMDEKKPWLKACGQKSINLGERMRA